MKTTADLNALIPIICELIANNDHEIGSKGIDRIERIEFYEPESNIVTYEEDGWLIEVLYKCTGEHHHSLASYYQPEEYYIRNIDAKLIEITASYENAGETIDFTEGDLKTMCEAVQKELDEIREIECY